MYYNDMDTSALREHIACSRSATTATQRAAACASNSEHKPGHIRYLCNSPGLHAAGVLHLPACLPAWIYSRNCVVVSMGTLHVHTLAANSKSASRVKSNLLTHTEVAAAAAADADVAQLFGHIIRKQRSCQSKGRGASRRNSMVAFNF